MQRINFHFKFEYANFLDFSVRFGKKVGQRVVSNIHLQTPCGCSPPASTNAYDKIVARPQTLWMHLGGCKMHPSTRAFLAGLKTHWYPVSVLGNHSSMLYLADLAMHRDTLSRTQEAQVFSQQFSIRANRDLVASVLHPLVVLSGAEHN